MREGGGGTGRDGGSGIRRVGTDGWWDCGRVGGRAYGMGWLKGRYSLYPDPQLEKMLDPDPYPDPH